MPGQVVGMMYVPAGYVKIYGATVQRNDYIRLVNLANKYSLWNNTTRTFTGNIVINSDKLTTTSDISGLQIGMLITGTGIPVGTTISNIIANVLTMTAKATVTTNGITVDWSSDVNSSGKFGIGDGTTTMVLPDWRGVVRRFLDGGKGYDVNRVLGSFQGDAIRNITGTFRTLTNLPSGTGAFEVSLYNNEGYSGVKANETHTYTFNPSKVVPTAPENRVKNIAEMAVMRY